MKKHLILATSAAAFVACVGLAAYAFVGHWRTMPVVTEVNGFAVTEQFPLRMSQVPLEQLRLLNEALERQLPGFRAYMAPDAESNPRVYIIHENGVAVSKKLQSSVSETVWAWIAKQSIIQDREQCQRAAEQADAERRMKELESQIDALRTENERMRQMMQPQAAPSASSIGDGSGE